MFEPHLDEETRFDLSGKVFLVTGATGLLGAQYCEALAGKGASLCITDINENKLVKISEKLKREFKVKILAITCDLTQEKDVISLVRNVRRTFSKLDGVVNNAAATGEYLLSQGNAFEQFETYSIDMWKKVLDINLTGAFLIARESGKLMLASGGGALINVSSIYGVRGPDHKIYEGSPFSSFAAYSASKAGVHGLTLWLSTYWAEKGIRVNTIVPGGVDNNHSEHFKSQYSKRTPLGRMAHPSDMVGIVVFLLSNASIYITGQQFVVDGGLSAW